MATRWLAAILATALTGSTLAVADNAGGLTATMESPVEIAARNYRLQVYETFHADRAEFDARLAKWATLETKWEQRGKPQGWRMELVRWLEDATVRSRPDSVKPLPPEPLGVVVDAAPPLDPSQSLRDPLTLGPDDAAVDGFMPDDLSDVKPAAKAPVHAEAAVSREPAAPAEATAGEKMPGSPAIHFMPPNPVDGAAAWLDSLGDQIGHDVGNLLGAAAAPNAKP